MNRRNKNKASATVKPSQPQKPTPPLAQTTTPPEQLPPPSAGPSLSQFAKSAPQKLPSPASTTSARLRKEWNNFEVWLSARRADRDRRVSEKLKELMAATGKSKLQKQQLDMSAFETNLNEELAEQARTEWLRRLGVAGLKEEDWVDMTEDEMKAIEAAFVPQMNTSALLSDTKAATPDHLSTAPGGVEWAAPVPGGWDAPSISAPPKASNKLQMDSAAPARSSPLSNGWGFFGEKPNVPTPESLWDMHVAKNSHKPPTPPSSNIHSSALPTPETLWDMHIAKKAPPPLTPPPTEPVSPDGPLEPSVVKRLPVRETSTPAPPKKVGINKPAKQPPPSQGLWGPSSADPPPEPPIAVPTYTGNSIESAHNHGYMSPLLIELECDEFPIASPDILSDELIEESIREWHQQAAEADIQLRKQLLSMHWAKRDWDELLGSHVQEMERNARTVVGHWKSMSDAEKERRLKEDKQRRLAGIRNVTSGNRRWGSSAPVERTSSPAPPVATPAKKTQAPRKGATKKLAATVEDATSSEWEERSTTPSIPTDKPKAGRKDSVDTESLWSKDPPAPKGPSGLLSSLWGRATAPPPEAPPTPAAHERRKPVNGPSKGVLPSVAEPTRTTTASPLWDEPQSQKIDKNYWSAPGASVEDEDDEPTGSSMWSQPEVRGGAASAWNFAVNTMSGEKTGAAQPPAKSSSPPVTGPGSFWSNEPAHARVMNEGPGVGSYGGAGSDGRFTPWKPSVLERPDADETTTKMANLAMEHLYQTADTDDAYDPNELHNAMSMYTKAMASSTRKKR